MGIPLEDTINDLYQSSTLPTPSPEAKTKFEEMTVVRPKIANDARNWDEDAQCVNIEIQAPLLQHPPLVFVLQI